MHVPVATPDLSYLEQRLAAEAVASTWISSRGAFLDEFCEMFGEVCEAEHVIPVANGTVALHVALLALGIGAGDEVIVPSMTYVATASAVVHAGATPVFVDMQDSTWCMDPDALAAAVSERTRAVIVVHLYGHPADMAAILDLTVPLGIPVIEDAAEATFSTFRGRPVGAIGDVGTFSFFGNKTITCGEGGAVVSNDATLAEKVWLLRGQGMDPKHRYYFPVVGYNYRLTNVQAAILVAQLRRREEMCQRRRELYVAYDRAFEQLPVRLQPRQGWAGVTDWLYTFELGPEVRQQEFMDFLTVRGVETRPVFIPIHTLPPYADFPRGPLEVTERFGARGVSLPTSSSFSQEQIDHVVRSVREFFG